MSGSEEASASEREAAARRSLEGVRVGDALASRFWRPINGWDVPVTHLTPAGPWQWTDDTDMSATIVEHLSRRGRIDQDELASAFARRFHPSRGYGESASKILRAIARGERWRELASSAFRGRGSLGNGAAMRSAPLGAFFADDPARLVTEAAAAAEITHAHPEGIAGAVAVAVMAGLVAAEGREFWLTRPRELLLEVAAHTPTGRVLDGVRRAGALLGREVATVAQELGNGAQITAADTVPLALWIAVRDLDDYPTAIWTCIDVGGDVDTLAAMAGGIIAAGGAAVPAPWSRAAEPLPGFPSAQPPERGDFQAPPQGEAAHSDHGSYPHGAAASES